MAAGPAGDVRAEPAGGSQRGDTGNNIDADPAVGDLDLIASESDDGTPTRTSGEAAPSPLTAAWRAATTRGRVTALVAVLAALLGTVTGWREWIGIAAALGVLLVAAVLMALGRSSCVVDLDLPRTRYVVGEPGSATMLVRNTSSRRMLPLRMELEVAGVPRTVPVPSLRGGAVHLVHLPLPTHRRAVIDIGPLRAVRGDVFGLIRRVVQWRVHRQVFVHPLTARPSGAMPGFVRDLEGEESALRTASDLSFHTLREYVPGDDRRFIHWKSSARSGTLQVREFMQTQRSLIAVVLSSNRDDYLGARDADAAGDRVDPTVDPASTPCAEFEIAVSCAASLVAELVRQRRDVVVDAAGTPIRGVTAEGVLDQFCVVDLDPRSAADAPDLVAQTRQVMRRYPRTSLLVLVFGSAVTPARLRAAVRACPPGVSALVLRARLESSPHPARLPGSGGTSVLTVPDVDALPAALRVAR